MASDVDICNLALSNLGDTATVTSLKPPDGSVQAQHCARFYPIARNALLEMHEWTFAMKRSTLAQLAENPSSTWDYAYDIPADMICMISILPADAIDDYEASFPLPGSAPFPPGYVPTPGPSFYEPQPFTVEVDGTGNQIILTNCPNAVLRYKGLVTDTTTFSPLFVMALSYLLASMLAGPLIKGDEGAKQAASSLAMANSFVSQAKASDANHGRIVVKPVTPWVAGR